MNVSLYRRPNLWFATHSLLQREKLDGLQLVQFKYMFMFLAKKKKEKKKKALVTR